MATVNVPMIHTEPLPEAIPKKAAPKANPVAWKLDILGPDGHVLASEKSYLWEKPTEN